MSGDKFRNTQFFEYHEKFTDGELKEMGIKTAEDQRYFLSHGLERVWFINFVASGKELKIEDYLGSEPFMASSQLKGGTGLVLALLDQGVSFDSIDDEGIRDVIVVGGIQEEVEGLTKMLPGRNVTVGNLYFKPLEDILGSLDLAQSNSLRLIRLDASKLDPPRFPDNSYDLWVMAGIEPTAYWDSDGRNSKREADLMVQKILKQALRVVRPGGYLVDGSYPINQELHQRLVENGYLEQSGLGVYRRTEKSFTTPSTSVEDEAKRIHEENMKIEHMPIISEKTILCHIIADSILPEGQKGMLKELEQFMRDKDDYKEKVVSLSVDSDENFIIKLESAKTRIEEYYRSKGYKVDFTVACHDKNLIPEIQEIGLQALAFNKESEGGMLQVEGIILALRVLQTRNIDKLLSVYKFLTGEEYNTNIKNIKDLAREILFTMPIEQVAINRIAEINAIIEENIKTAA
ncbi:MAG: hypothetical protein P9L90_04285 [Candidatus Aadella gelida]|nr:hypothetical protein [Candidatus Aadella gelida]